MSLRITGISLFAISTLLLILAFENFRNLWYLIITDARNVWPFELAVMVGQVVTYLTAYALMLSCALPLIRQRQIKRRYPFLIALLLVWLVLEMPLYKCEFGFGQTHSFWKSHKMHFH